MALAACLSAGLVGHSATGWAAGKAAKGGDADKGGGPEVKEDLAGFLVKPAEAAMKDRKYPLAVSLWSGIVAIRGDGDEAAWRLAEAWTLGGKFKQAQDVLGQYAAAVIDPAKKAKANEEIASLGKRERGFGSGRFAPAPATTEAKEAFKRGRAAFKAKQYDRAIAYFRAGIVMAPDLPGNYRELAEAYDKIGKPADANEFFVRYLRKRPFGKNADNVRARLAKSKMVGKLTISSALPCDQVWIEGQMIPTKLPVKDQVVAPGQYELLCFNETYHHAQFETVEVKVGDSAKVSFDWAILENKLDPWGRVVIENPRNKDSMQDIGLWPEVGVPIPSDRRALKIVMTAGDGSKKKEELVKLAPGQRYVLKW